MDHHLVRVLARADVVVAAESVDGVLTTAALRRLIEPAHPEIVFTPPHTAHRLAAQWNQRTVVLIGLGAAEQHEATALLEALRAGGNRLLAVIDASSDPWEALADSEWDHMFVRPRWSPDPSWTRSAAQALSRALNHPAHDLGCIDEQAAALLAAAEDPAHPITEAVHRCVAVATSSATGSDHRFEHLTEVLARGDELDATTQAWVSEYAALQAVTDTLAGETVDLADGIVRVDTRGLRVDPEALLRRLCQSARVVVLAGAGERTSIATSEPGLRVLDLVHATAIPAAGFAHGAHIDPADEHTATEAVRAAVRAATLTDPQVLVVFGAAAHAATDAASAIDVIEVAHTGDWTQHLEQHVETWARQAGVGSVPIQAHHVRMSGGAVSLLRPRTIEARALVLQGPAGIVWHTATGLPAALREHGHDPQALEQHVRQARVVLIGTDEPARAPWDVSTVVIEGLAALRAAARTAPALTEVLPRLGAGGELLSALLAADPAPDIIDDLIKDFSYNKVPFPDRGCVLNFSFPDTVFLLHTATFTARELLERLYPASNGS